MAAGALCMCGHRRGVHEDEDKGAYCNRCDCMEFEANTEVPVMDDVPEPVPVPEPVSEPVKCLCGHEERRHGMESGHVSLDDCRVSSCDCHGFEPDPATIEDVVNPPKPKPKQTKIVAPPEPPRQRPPAANEVRYRDERAPEPEGKKVDGFPHKPEAGTWRALVEDLATGGIYLVARGSKKFVSETLRTHIEANPLPQTKRGVVSLDHEYVKARDDAPFFNVPLNGLVLP